MSTIHIRKCPRDETTAQGSYVGLPHTDHRRAQRSIMAEEHNAQHSRMDVAEKKLEQIKVKLEEIDTVMKKFAQDMCKVSETQKEVALLVSTLNFKFEKMEKMIATEQSVALLEGTLSAKIENMEKMIASEKRNGQDRWEAHVAQEKLARIAACFRPDV